MSLKKRLFSSMPEPWSKIEEAWEYLDIWAAGANADATKLLAALKSAVGRALPALEAIS